MSGFQNSKWFRTWFLDQVWGVPTPLQESDKKYKTYPQKNVHTYKPNPRKIPMKVHI